MERNQSRSVACRVLPTPVKCVEQTGETTYTGPEVCLTYLVTIKVHLILHERVTVLQTERL